MVLTLKLTLIFGLQKLQVASKVLLPKNVITYLNLIINILTYLLIVI